MKCQFDNIVVIGCGTIAVTVLNYIIDNKKEYGYECEFVRYEKGVDSPIEKICHENHIEYREIHKKEEMNKYFKAIDKPSLVISAGNYYLFPQDVVRKEKLTIINFHNALLPKYPGINAPSWCIYYDEKKTGVTWHYVTEGIDSGDILYQQEHIIRSGIKAFELVAELMELAQKGLEVIFRDLMFGNAKCYAQNQESYPMCYARDIPGNGRFELTDEPRDVYKLLRSVDFGKKHIFPPVYFSMNEKLYEVVKYRLGGTKEIQGKDNWICLALDAESSLLIKYKERN